MKKGTWIVFGLVAVLGLLYFISRENQVSVGVKQLKLSSFAKDKVDKIEIKAKEPIELNKRDGVWMLTLHSGERAREVRADQNHVNNALDAVLALRSSHYVTNLKEKYEELGLLKDAHEIKLSIGDKPVFGLVLGKNASGSTRYAKLPEENDVYVVRGSFWEISRNGAFDFRDRQIWSLGEGEIDRFTIKKTSGGELVLVKDDSGSWQFDASQKGLKEGFRPDKASLQRLVQSGVNLTASGFADDSQPEGPVLILVAQGKKTETVEIFSPGNNKYLARRVGDKQVFEIHQHNFDRFNVTPDSLRDLSVLRFDRNGVTDITLKHGKMVIVVKKKDGQWQIVEPKNLPEKFEFDPNGVDDALSVLSNLSGERLATTKDMPKNSSIEKDWLVELTTDKNEKIRLAVEKSAASKEEYLVRGNIDNEIYVVKAARLKTLNSGVNAFKKEDFELPPINENTKGFNTLPVDVQRKLLNIAKEKK
jgi:hypothetical protein